MINSSSDGERGTKKKRGGRPKANPGRKTKKGERGERIHFPFPSTYSSIIADTGKNQKGKEEEEGDKEKICRRRKGVISPNLHLSLLGWKRMK